LRRVGLGIWGSKIAVGSSYLTLKQVVDKIEALTREPGFVYTLALILMRDLFLSPEDIADINPREHLNIQEITFLVGLFVKTGMDFTLPTEEESSSRPLKN